MQVEKIKWKTYMLDIHLKNPALRHLYVFGQLDL